MIQYSREVPNDAENFERAMVDTVDHVRGHLSACVDPDDSEDARAGEVEIVYTAIDGGTLVTGVIHAEPDAPYLRDDFDPESDGDYVFLRYSEEGREDSNWVEPDFVDCGDPHCDCPGWETS